MIEVQLTQAWRVDCRASIPLPISSRAAWGQMRDFRRFVSCDPFHTRVDPDRESSGANAFTLWHGWQLLRFPRRGRILKWAEGSGYTFSDLSRRHPRKGFPHIYEYRLIPTSSVTSLLQVTVRGRWTATWLPRWLIRVWLGGVMMLIHIHLTAFFALYKSMREKEAHRCMPAPPGDRRPSRNELTDAR